MEGMEVMNRDWRGTELFGEGTGKKEMDWRERKGELTEIKGMEKKKTLTNGLEESKIQNWREENNVE